MVIKQSKHLTLLVPLVHPQVVDVLNIAEDRAIAGPGFGLRKDGSGRHQGPWGPCGFQR